MTRWPAMMLRKTAAAYVELSEAAFEREIIAGNIPAAITFGGKPHWYKRQMDEYLERLTGSGGDWRKQGPLYNAA